MFTTFMAPNGDMGIEKAIVIPLAAGAIIAIVLMVWTEMSVSAFVLGCAFIGSSQIAPVCSEWINRIFFSVTGDVSYLIDPIDLFFALFKIDQTDGKTLFFMLFFMSMGCYKQINYLKQKGIPLNTPLITYEKWRSCSGYF